MFGNRGVFVDEWYAAAPHDRLPWLNAEIRKDCFNEGEKLGGPALVNFVRQRQEGRQWRVAEAGGFPRCLSRPMFAHHSL